MLVFIDSMNWQHLPSPGGIYDQHPDFVDKAKFYMGRKALAQQEREKQEAARQRAQANKGGGRRR